MYHDFQDQSITVRGDGPSAGYISVGFFGGEYSLTLFPDLTKELSGGQQIGECRIVYLYTFVAIALELAKWLVPSISSTAALYPCRNEPRWARIPPVAPHRVHSLDHSYHDYGGGRHPFGHRGLALRAGIQRLEFVVVAMLAAMLVLWAVAPAHKI
ncbi:hypothetical protein DFH08DRAFT_996005 [Mycena albidolilacea]|uniref:Uncharacterized protein n=1 Tax=Mycena albidolilacea TaxID=1033008 RepID=A0AAD7A763_9AGAR|nr:hypothetical protein DFH08DRAFT_996005 [Mycena albidolilacea]